MQQRNIYLSIHIKHRGVIMSKKLFALLLLAAVGSSVNAGAKLDKVVGWGDTGLGYALDAIWVLKPAAHIKDESKRKAYIADFESTKLGTVEKWKRQSRWVGIPYNFAFVTGAATAALFAGKKITKKIQVRRAKKAAADKELA